MPTPEWTSELESGIYLELQNVQYMHEDGSMRVQECVVWADGQCAATS